jgi:hypothetical protein
MIVFMLTYFPSWLNGMIAFWIKKNCGWIDVWGLKVEWFARVGSWTLRRKGGGDVGKVEVFVNFGGLMSSPFL